MLTRLLNLKKWSRLPEAINCCRRSAQWTSLIPAYGKLRRLEYPFLFRTRSGAALELQDWNDLTTAWHVCFSGEYRLDRSYRRIVDLGANIGVFSIWAARQCPAASIVAVEPFPSTFQRLTDNVRRNGLADRITCIQAAAVPVDGPIEIDGRSDVSSYGRSIVWNVKNDTAITVPGMALATILDDAGFKEVDLLKIDIEGAEYELIFRSDDATIRRNRVITFEYHGRGEHEWADPEGLWNRLKDLGYRCTRHRPGGWSGVAEFTRKD